jgi:6-phosphogluconate dehydrogenase
MKLSYILLNESGLGYWPAFWMLGPGRWPENGEIDIMEDVNALSEVSGTIHCGTDPGGPCNEPNGIGSGLTSCSGCQTGYHTYTMILNRTNTSNESITFYLDGNQYFSVSESQVGTSTWQAAFDHNLSIILDLAMGGGHPRLAHGGEGLRSPVMSGAMTWELLMTEGKADIGVTGLAVMGRNLARNLARHGHTVALHNRSPERTRSLVKEHGDEGTFIPSESMRDFVDSLERPRAIIVMVQAGAATDAVIDELVPLLDNGDIVVDCGNAHYMDTRRREAALREHGLHFVGCGVSGGEEGALNGPSIMPGGSKESYAKLGPILESIAASYDGTPCCTHAGPDGAGHFVKMVHNGIEYADMQLIAEAYDLLRAGLGAAPPEIGEIFRTWNEGDLDSYLIQITADVLSHTDALTGKPFIDIVLDEAEQKGTGRWTVQNALDLGIPITGIAEATFARSLSGHAGQRAAARETFGTDLAPLAISDRDAFVEDVRRALYASKVVAYAQGFDQIAAGSAEYGWDINRGAMATIWRAGCIIRARFLDRIRAAYDENAALPSLLVAPYFAAAVRDGDESWRRVVAQAASAGIPAPAFSSSLAYYDGLRKERLPAALIQGLRDYFGAHTYHRTDSGGTFHTEWGGDRREHQA